jgi:hypothetical protein
MHVLVFMREGIFQVVSNLSLSMQWDNLEHRVPDGGLLVAAAFCWTNAAWSGQDHQLHGADRPSSYASVTAF